MPPTLARSVRGIAESLERRNHVPGFTKLATRFFELQLAVFHVADQNLFRIKFSARSNLTIVGPKGMRMEDDMALVLLRVAVIQQEMIHIRHKQFTVSIPVGIPHRRNFFTNTKLSGLRPLPEPLALVDSDPVFWACSDYTGIG